MKKTLLIAIDFWPNIGGVANYYFNLCKQLGAQVVVLTTNLAKQKNIRKLKEDFDFKIIRKDLLLNLIWPKWILMFWYVWRVVRQEKIETLWVGEILPTGIVVYLLTKFLKLPYIVSCHGMDILQANKIKRRKKMAQKILKEAKLITVNSYYTRELVKKMGVADDKIKVIYPGVLVDNNHLTKNKDIKEKFIRKYDLRDKKIILSVGRLVERKGFDKVIEAMPQVVTKVSKVVYLIAGVGGDELRLKNLSNEVVESVVFLGKVSDKEKWVLMDLCDVFITPARKNNEDIEGFGIVYLEANLMGKPVIAGNVGGAREAVIDNKTGLLVNPENINEISQAIIDLLNNQELADKLGKAGYQRVIDKFSWEKIGEDMKKVLNFKL